MQSPPFKLGASSGIWATSGSTGVTCCDHGVPGDAKGAVPQRIRLVDLDPHMHCSVIGTCLGTVELRKLMSRFEDVHGESDLAVHHAAVSRTGQCDEAAKALQRLLDHRHSAQVRRFARLRDTAGLQQLWADAMRSGEVPGAYWALLTHRAATTELRQQAFGDVHMLSHLAGASRRAELRRDAALKHENADLRDRIAQQQERLHALDSERTELQATLTRKASELSQWKASVAANQESTAELSAMRHSLAEARTMLALHTERRERSEQWASATAAENKRLNEELQHSRQQLESLASESAAAEQLLRDQVQVDATSVPARRLDGRRVLYVGGRPSSAVAIRELVQRQGGQLQRHDGGLEDRKGLLAAAVAWAEVVVFPVDCIDHDSAGNLKRLCQRDGKPLLPLRSASVTSFAAALLRPGADAASATCWRSA